MDFLLNTNNLILIFVALTSGILLAMPKLLKGGSKAINVQEAVRLTNQNDGQFIDIRSHDHFKAGNIPQSRNIPLADIKNKLNSLPKDKPLIIVCDMGRQAAGVTATLRKEGFQQAYTLEGGLRSWLEAGLPITKKHHGQHH